MQGLTFQLKTISTNFEYDYKESKALLIKF